MSAEHVIRATDDRRPIDPPPIVQLRVIDRGATDSIPSRSSSPDSGGMWIFVDRKFYCSLRHRFDAVRPLTGNQYVSSFLQNPYYFMYASLAQPDEDVEIHWFNVSVLSRLKVSSVPYDCVTREGRQGAQPDLWFRPCITSRTQRIAGKTLPFSYSPISV